MKFSVLYNIEKKCIGWIEKNITIIAFIIAFVFSIIIRISNFDYLSADAVNALIPWFDVIKENGGVSLLHRQVGNYNVPYQTVIALLTYLPFEPIHAIKLFSCLFDYLLSAAIGYLVYIITSNNKTKVFYSLIISMYLPVIVMNSSVWGQCDSIYTFFCILCLILFFKEKNTLAFIAYGFAFSFKLQCIFFFPFLILYYLYKKRFSVLNFSIIPITLTILSLGGILQGRNIKEPLYLYLVQSDTHPYTSLGYASFWNLLEATMSDKYYSNIKYFAILTAIVAIGLIMTYVLKSEKELDNIMLVKLAFILAYTCVLFLPAMHERYDYAYIMLALIIAFVDYKFIPISIVLNYISMRSYASYLFNNAPNWNVLVFLNILAYAVSLIILIKDIGNLPTITSNSEES